VSGAGRAPPDAPGSRITSSIRRGLGNPYWLEDDEPARVPKRHDGRVDVAIVGAGVTGCSAALRLAAAGLDVRVHDQRGVAEGASGRNGGFALRGGATRYDIARETYGRDRALGLWQWTERALDRMEQLAGDSLTRTGSLRLAADEEEREHIRAEYDALREDGIAARWIDRADLAAHLGAFHGAIEHPRDGSLQPARFVRRLAARAAEAGADIREHSRRPRASRRAL
jgi:glycine/D-amino acid oxidase-like deaminating enzyme